MHAYIDLLLHLIVDSPVSREIDPAIISRYRPRIEALRNTRLYQTLRLECQWQRDIYSLSAITTIVSGERNEEEEEISLATLYDNVFLLKWKKNFTISGRKRVSFTVTS